MRRERGGALWAVVLEITDQAEPDSDMVRIADQHSAYIVNPSCDDGAREGLRLRPEKDYWYVVVYLPSQELGFAYKKRYAPGGVIGVVNVTPALGDDDAGQCVRQGPPGG